MIYQNNRDLRYDLRAIGCEALSCFAAGSIFCGESLRPRDINSIIRSLESKGFWGKKTGLNHSVSYADLFANFFHNTNFPEYAGDQIGSIIAGTVKFWDWVRVPTFNFVIERGFTGA